VLLDVVSPQSISEAIIKLSDPSVRHKLGEAGHAAAVGEFNWQVIEQRLLELYSSLLNRP
jgi:glycosyltransferase involved in cell wall biosynthesis